MKFLLSVLLGLFLSKYTFGQISPIEPPALFSKPKFILMAGPGICFVRENETFKKWGVLKFGFSAGLGIIKPITPKLKMQGSVLFEKKGYKTSKIDTAYNGSTWVTGKLINDRSYNYATFAISSQYSFGRRNGFNAGIGVYYGLLTKAKWQIIVTALNLNTSSLISPSKDDYGVTLNFGYTVPFNKGLLIGFQLTENYGLTQLMPPPPFPSEKNNSIVLIITLSKNR